MGRPFLVVMKLGQPNNSDNIVSHRNSKLSDGGHAAR
jgi:hypothetical protein